MTSCSRPATSCQAVVEAPAAQFEGTYRSQDTTSALSAAPGRFTVLVDDQGEPSRSGGDFTGDRFSIELYGGPYALYTRGGYIEGGNIQVQLEAS